MCRTPMGMEGSSNLVNSMSAPSLTEATFEFELWQAKDAVKFHHVLIYQLNATIISENIILSRS